MNEIIFYKPVRIEETISEYRVIETFGVMENQVRRYKKELDLEHCPVCQYPLKPNLNCHSALSTGDVQIPSLLINVGYYKRKISNRITEDIRKIRKTTFCNDFEIEVLARVAAHVINKNKMEYNYYTFIPSRNNKKPCLEKLIHKTGSILSLEFLDPSVYLIHDNLLHEANQIRKIDSLKERKNMTTQIFQSINKEVKLLRGKNVLIFDDLIQTGSSMHRIGEILKENNASEVHGFAWLRAIDSDKLLQ